jgi:alpha-beta hydrolase superfamily lysophospholipase
MKIIRLLLAICSCLTLGACALLSEPDGPEAAVCGWIKEPLVFALWSHTAGKPHPEWAKHFPSAEAVTYTTKDGHILSGYKLRSTATNGAVLGTLLVAQGNAMLSDRVLGSLSYISEAGLDVYIFDYRGYGNSEGRSRLKAIVGDYREMADHLTVSPGGKKFLYGISFGGIVMMNVIGAGGAYDRAVIDSAPSRLSDHGCPTTYDPVENVPADASRIMFIAGKKDVVVPLEDSGELMRRARAQGARTEIKNNYAHPFMDGDAETQRSRLDLIREFMQD